MKIGILGGTFDPVHYGHLKMAETAVREEGLDRLLVMPAGRPYFKGKITPYGMRCDMIQLSLEELGNDRLDLSLLEGREDAPTYTFETLRKLKDLNPGCDLFFVCGEDVFSGIHRWMRPEEVLGQATLLVFRRDTEESPSDEKDEERIAGLKRICPDVSCRFMKGSIPSISSTMIRERIRSGGNTEGLLPASVASYIKTHGLYIS